MNRIINMIARQITREIVTRTMKSAGNSSGGHAQDKTAMRRSRQAMKVMRRTTRF